MILKITILVLIVACCGYIGYGIGNYYKSRQKFYVDFLNFLEICEVQITFYHNKIDDLFKNYLEGNNYSKEFEKFIKKVESSFKNKQNLEIDGILLTNDEKKLLSNFFSNLGKTNSDKQKELIEFNKAQFKSIKETAEKNAAKNSPLATKLGFLFGLAIAIFLI